MKISRSEFEEYKKLKEEGKIHISIVNADKIIKETSLSWEKVDYIEKHRFELDIKYPELGEVVKDKWHPKKSCMGRFY